MNELLSSFFDRNTKAEPSDEEYVGEDGLFYCKKCHTPTQCRVEIAGRQSIVSCMCSCAKEELDKYERELAEMNRRNHIYSLKATGIQERALYDWTFEKAADSPIIQMARRYVDSWPEVKKNNLGLLLWGDVGTGKSFTAACIANALLETGVPVLMTNFSKILNQMGGMYSEERYKYIASFSSFELLIIDDLGIERNTEYALEQVYAVIDERYKSKKPPHHHHQSDHQPDSQRHRCGSRPYLQPGVGTVYPGAGAWDRPAHGDWTGQAGAGQRPALWQLRGWFLCAD